MKDVRLHLSRPPGDVANAVLSPHVPAVSYLDLEPLDFLGKLDALRVRQQLPLVLEVHHVQHFAQKLHNRL
jgi:hypothetical protein